MRAFGVSSFTPLVISSGIGTLVARTLEGNRPAFYVPHYILRSPREILLYAGLGLVLAVAAVHFIRSFYAVSDRFAAWKAPDRLKPIVGALLTGLVAILVPQVMGNGYEHVEHALAGRFGGWVLPLPDFPAPGGGEGCPGRAARGLGARGPGPGQDLRHGFHPGLGQRGRRLRPVPLHRAMLGGAYGTLVNAYFPEIASSPGTYAVVGMGGSSRQRPTPP